MIKETFFNNINNIEKYRDFIDEVVKGFSYPLYINGKRVDKRKIISENAIDDAEDWFDNNISVSYLINNNRISIFVG